jgi:hypothetical protein
MEVKVRIFVEINKEINPLYNSLIFKMIILLLQLNFKLFIKIFLRREDLELAILKFFQLVVKIVKIMNLCIELNMIMFRQFLQNWHSI